MCIFHGLTDGNAICGVIQWWITGEMGDSSRQNLMSYSDFNCSQARRIWCLRCKKTSKREILWIITRYKEYGVYHLWNLTTIVGLLSYKLRGPKIKCSLRVQFWLQCCQIITNTTTLGLPFRARISSYAQIKIRHKTTDMITYQGYNVIS